MSKLIGKSTNNDDIIAFLNNPDGKEETDLSAKQRELLTWYIDAYTQIRNYNCVPDAISVLQKLGERRGTPISMASARRYIYDALDIFGDVSKMKAEAINHLTIEMLLDAASMARDQNNPIALIQAAKELRAAGANEDPNAINKDDLEQHTIIINVDKRTMHVLDALTKKGPIDLDVLMGNAMSGLAEDIPFLEEKNE